MKKVLVASCQLSVKIMHPILFSIYKLNFYSYGLFAAISLIAAYFMMKYLAQKRKLPTDKLLDNVLWVFAMGVILARIVYFIVYYNQFQSFWQLFYIWQGGLVSFGGIIGGLIAFVFLFRKNLLKWLDILAVSFLLGLFFWRIGCTLAGDHPAIYSNLWFAINHQIPITIFESIAGLLGFLIAYYFFNRKIITGIIFFATIGYYGLIRIIIDQWRLENTIIYNLHWGQIMGIIMLIVSTLAIITLILYDRFRKRIK